MFETILQEYIIKYLLKILQFCEWWNIRKQKKWWHSKGHSRKAGKTKHCRHRSNTKAARTESVPFKETKGAWENGTPHLMNLTCSSQIRKITRLLSLWRSKHQAPNIRELTGNQGLHSRSVHLAAPPVSHHHHLEILSVKNLSVSNLFVDEL